MRDAAAHRSDYMWPWEEEPKSIATGSSTTRRTTGAPWSRACSPPADRQWWWTNARCWEANDLAVEATGIPVDPTGSSGLAGLMALAAEGLIGDDERVAVLFTGSNVGRSERSGPDVEGEVPTDEELRGPGHPVAEGLRTRRVLPACSRSPNGCGRIAEERKNSDLLADKTLVTAFYQPSTRTRLATEAAMHRLGGHVLGFSDAKMTRAGDFYQESIKDTLHMLEYYGDVIAIRHFQQGAPAEAAHWSSVPIINCGDGWGEHPTQVLTDLYTTWRGGGTSTA